MKNHDAALAREITERVTEEVTKRVAEHVIASLVKICKRMNLVIEDAIETVITEYGFTEEKARNIVGKYW